MKRLRVDEVARMLPELDELQPVLDLIFARAVPDPEREWSGSGELGTVGDRLVPSGALEDTADELADQARDHLRAVYRTVARAVEALAADEPTGAARAFLEASDLEHDARRLERAEAYAAAAHRAVRGERDGAIRARCLRRLARILRSQGRLGESEVRYEEALDLARSSGAAREAVIAAIGRGNISVDRGRWSEAEGWYREATNLLEEGEPGPELWHVELNRSIVAYRTGDLETSREHLDRAERVAAVLDDPEAEPILGNARGKLHALAGDHEQAAEALAAALEAADDARARVTISVNLADALLSLGHTLDAGELARDAERIALREGVVPKLPDVYRILARIARTQGHDDAMVFHERALEIIRSRRLPDFERAQTLEDYGEMEAELGRTDAARDRLREAERLYDGLGMETGAERVRSLLGSMDDAPPS